MESEQSVTSVSLWLGDLFFIKRNDQNYSTEVDYYRQLDCFDFV